MSKDTQLVTPSFQKWLLLAATKSMGLRSYAQHYTQCLLGLREEVFPGATEMLSLVMHLRLSTSNAERENLARFILHEDPDPQRSARRSELLAALDDLLAMGKDEEGDESWCITQRAKEAVLPFFPGTKVDEDIIFLGSKSSRDASGRVILGSGAEISREAQEIWLSTMLTEAILHENVQFSPEWIDDSLPILPLPDLMQYSYEPTPGADSLARLWWEWGDGWEDYDNEDGTPFLRALIKQLIPRAAMVTWEEIFSFAALVEEYNLEWALAAMEWSDAPC